MCLDISATSSRNHFGSSTSMSQPCDRISWRKSYLFKRFFAKIKSFDGAKIQKTYAKTMHRSNIILSNRQFITSHRNGHGHSCDHVTARVKIKMFCKQYSEKRTPLKYICTHLIFSTLQIFEKRLRKVGESSKESQSFMPINSQKDGMFLRESYNVLQVVNIFRFATNLCGHMVTAVTVTVSVWCNKLAVR